MIEDDTKTGACWACRHPFDFEDQKKCLKCESWQSAWRRFLATTTVVISLMVGLAGVAAAAFSVVYQQAELKRIEQRDSDIDVLFRSSRIDTTYTNLRVQFSIINRSFNRALLEPVVFCTDHDGDRVQFRIPGIHHRLPSWMTDYSDRYMVSDEVLSESNPLNGRVHCAIKLVNERGVEDGRDMHIEG